ncbi:MULTISPECIES: DUF4150 domain-containing protein [Variovorax]|uniref:Uncharacterized protein n=1 Tax=Variovorax paradoxus (strain EPS) TaxID=595537 RepID=E6V5W4_VARPE|nr:MULTISPECIES: DUF4150 domain-containing protein [Variovorax]ADU37105.1 hypothetical protein Varpa_2914 [Variovorax paradoxus EPS]MDH6166452.1 hypothetical protein [Variovorax boronicumulans]
MFFAAQGPSLDIGVPDVCKTPAVPIPHIDIGLGLMAIPNVPNIFWSCMMAHNKKTKIPLTFGDTAGIGLGVRVPSVMGQSKKITASNTFLIKGSPATRVTSFTKQNRGNVNGILATPPQLTCVNLCA